MSFWRKLFGLKPKLNIRQTDWLFVEGKLRELETLSQSKSQSDIKQLIIQSDNLVDSILKQSKAPGTTMGERLRVLRGRIKTPVYRALWAAHIKRNELVHDSGSFVAEWEAVKHFQSYKDAISEIRGLR